MSYISMNLLNLSLDDAAAVRLLIVLNIILISIVMLWFIIRILVPLIIKFLAWRKEKAAFAETVTPDSGETDSDTGAAIATALYLYFNEMHDEESDVITVKRVSKTYSPWSSKLYSMRNLR
ncbi:MAG: hypothetical protein JXR67_01325 [Bacteroidales bacterium]|nr:hypothetical protein [Bacteroidales bacterium]